MPAMLSSSDMRHFVEFACRLADSTGAILRAHRSDNGSEAINFQTKSDLSPVTELDRRLEALMREMIEERFPEHGILGEEFAPKDVSAELSWVIDPIDGTKQFIAGIPVYGTLISLTHHGKPVLGVIDHPATSERWVGAAGMPTTYNGRPARTRACPALSDALMSCSSTEPIGDRHREAFERVRARTKWRIYGASCYAYARLASGQIDLSVDSGGHQQVDYCALVPVIEGAGGVITDWEGRDLTIRSGNSLIAAGDPARHADALRLLRAA